MNGTAVKEGNVLEEGTRVCERSDGVGVGVAETREAEAPEARAEERDVADDVAGDALEGVGPDLEALEGLVSRGEDGERGIREPAAAVGHHLAEAARAEAGSSRCRLVAP